jgi:hypothetical protein
MTNIDINNGNNGNSNDKFDAKNFSLRRSKEAAWLETRPWVEVTPPDTLPSTRGWRWKAVSENLAIFGRKGVKGSFSAMPLPGNKVDILIYDDATWEDMVANKGDLRKLRHDVACVDDRPGWASRVVERIEYEQASTLVAAEAAIMATEARVLAELEEARKLVAEQALEQEVEQVKVVSSSFICPWGGTPFETLTSRNDWPVVELLEDTIRVQHKDGHRFVATKRASKYERHRIAIFPRSIDGGSTEPLYGLGDVGDGWGEQLLRRAEELAQARKPVEKPVEKPVVEKKGGAFGPPSKRAPEEVGQPKPKMSGTKRVVLALTASALVGAALGVAIHLHAEADDS